jgi:hypothetical protein
VEKPREEFAAELQGNARTGLDMPKRGGYMPAQAGFAGSVGV